MRKLLLLLLLCAGGLMAQVSFPNPVRSGASLPATCTPGGLVPAWFLLTAAGPTGTPYYCSAPNTWTAASSNGGGSPAGSAGDVQVYATSSTFGAGTGANVAKPLNSLGWYNATSNGMVCDNSTDDTSAFNTLLSTVNTAGGGTIWLPSICKLTSAEITFPNDGDMTSPSQNSIRITGAGFTAGIATLPTCRSGLNMTFNATAAKLKSFGVGSLIVDNICLMDTANDQKSFLLVTNTTPYFKNVAVVGFSGGFNANAIILGGTTNGTHNDATGQFQGYGGEFATVGFYNVRTAFLFRASVNSMWFSNIWTSTSVGCNGCAIFDMSWTTSGYMTGNHFIGGTIELGQAGTTAYLCGSHCTGNEWSGNSSWDASSTSTVYNFTGSSGNQVLSSYDNGPGSASATYHQFTGCGVLNKCIGGVATASPASVDVLYPNVEQPFGATFYNDGSVIAAANSAPFTVPYACSIRAWNASVAPSGTATFKVWKIATGTAIPTVANSINTSGVGVSTGTTVFSSTVSDFTSTVVSANDVVIISMTAVTGSPTSATFGVQCQ